MLFQSFERVGHFSIKPQRALLSKEGEKVMDSGFRFTPPTLWVGGPTIIDTDNLTDLQVIDLEGLWGENYKDIFEKWLLARPRRWRVINKLPERKRMVEITESELARLRAANVPITEQSNAPDGTQRVVHGPRTVMGRGK